MGVVLDSSWLIALEKARVDLSDLPLHLPEDAAISAVTYAEMRVGVELADEAHHDARRVYLERVSALTAILDFDRSAASEYARLAAILRRSGNQIGERDLMIAATAVARGLPVATLNRAEFERVPGLEILDLTLPTPE